MRGTVHRRINRRISRIVILWMFVMPGLAHADGDTTVGAVGAVGSLLKVLDANTQKTLRAQGALKPNDNVAQTFDKDAGGPNCAQRFKTAIDDAAQRTVKAAAPADPVKKFNESINSCLSTIQHLTQNLDFTSFSSVTDAFKQKLADEVKNLADQVISKMCESAASTWDSAVNNAINTVNNGINQAGSTTFGNFVSANTGGTTTPASTPQTSQTPQTPASPAPVKAPSTVPGL